jgi:hypothetical protein
MSDISLIKVSCVDFVVVFNTFGGEDDITTSFCSLLLNIYYSVIKSRRLRWVGHAASMVERCIQDFGGQTGGKETTWETQE